MLDGIRVLDDTTTIAGPYCTKLLVDAGAQVRKVEPTGGDPLRSWRSGGLFEYLHRAKDIETTTDAGTIDLSDMDVWVTERRLDAAQLDEIWAAHPALVVVTISAFGADGPWADRPATEFTLQAAMGSIGGRGLPEDPPFAAGGRLGEWITGTYAAVATLAALRTAQRSGRGEHVDLAMFDAMAVTMVTFPSVFAEFTGWPDRTGPERMIEIPSVEPTADGYAVFTTNSAQQFADFLIFIERADLLEHPELSQIGKRFENRHEFLAAVHAYTTEHTTAELLDGAALFRIPSGPVLDGATVPEFEHFRANGVFEPSESGRFVQPRTPYRMPTARVAADDAAPRPAAGTGPGSDPDADALPLAGLRVIDCTAWWAGPAMPHVLAALGADVIKIESVSRPDFMRYSSVKPPTEPDWWEWGPMFHALNVNKRAITLDLTAPEGREVFDSLLATADVLVENYTPRVMEQFGLDWDHVHAVNPRTVMVRMPAFGLSGPWRDRTGFAQTMECITGMAWLTGFPDGDPTLVRGACDPVAGMHAVFAALVALDERDRTGAGQFVEVPMVEAALNIAAEPVIEHSATGEILNRQGNRGPVSCPQGIYPSAGDDNWVAIAVPGDDQWRALGKALGSPSWAEDPALDTVEGRRAAEDQLDAALAAWSTDLDGGAVVELLSAAGVPAEVVITPRDVSRNPQLRHRRLFEPEVHPLTGRNEVPGLPFRFSRIDHWVRTPAPTIGQHNAAVFDELGLSAERQAELTAADVIGTRPLGLS